MGNVGGPDAGEAARGRWNWRGRNGITGLLALSLLAAILVMLPARAGGALPSPEIFQLDGNVLTQAADGPGDDWDKVVTNTSSAFSKSFIPEPIEGPANDVTYFAIGQKDTDDIPSWNACGNGAPGKDELDNAMAAAYTDPSNQHTILYFGADRDSTNGDSNIGFWFNQDSAFGLNKCGFNGKHQTGDLFVVSAFTNGGSQPTVDVYQWQGAALNTTPIASGQSDCSTEPNGNLACGIVNKATITTPWSYQGTTPGSIPANGFFEGGIDLTQLAQGAAIPCFTSYLADTRTSQTLTATAKDFAFGNLNSCGSIELKKHWVGVPGNTTINIGKTAGASDIATKSANGADADTLPQQVNPGTYHVSETTPRNTSTTSPQGGYTTSLACVNTKDPLNPVTVATTAEDGSVPPGSQGDNLPVTSGDVIVCTYTNTFIKVTPSAATTLHNASGGAVIPVSPVQHLALGTSVYDTATITPNDGNPLTGTLTYEFFSGSTTCSGTPAHVDTGLALNAQSTATGPLGAGNYSFHAKYVAGTDPAHNDSTFSACEPFIVDQATLHATTTIHDAAHAAVTAPVALGSVLHDTAHITGQVGGFSPAGNVTFKLYPSLANCNAGTNGTTVGTTAGTDAANGDPRSVDSTPFAAGSYAYQGSIAGDSNYAGATSACEPFTVNQAQLHAATTIHNAAHVAVTSPVPLGSVLHDTAQITGQVGGFAPSGAVTFTFYASSTDCSAGGTPIATAASPDSATGDPRSIDTGGLPAGNFAFRASVAGDSNYLGDTSACEPFVVSKAQLHAATTIHNAAHAAVTAPVALGSVLHDTAQITGQVNGYAPSGAVTFIFYTNSTDCSTGGTPIATAPGLDTGNNSPRSVDTSALAAGNYAFKAAVAGDGNYLGDTSACEPFVVNKVQLHAATTIHNAAHTAVTAPVALGSVLHDTAQITGQINGVSPSGAVTFTFYTNSTDCSAGGASIATAASPDAGNGDPRSVDTGALGAGNYAFKATVAGDSNYTGDTSACEPFVVNKAQLHAATTIHNAAHAAVTAPVALGSVLHDTAQITGQVGGFSPSGGVTFTFYTSSTDCSAGGASIATAASPDAGNGDPRSVDTSALGAGNYAFKATVAGDSNYTGDTSACEPFVVNKAQLAAATTIHNATHAAVTAPVTLGSVLHDTAQITGQVGGFSPSGAVTFTFYTNSTDCSAGGASIATAASPDTGNGDPRSVDTSALASGNYAFKATVAGDSNYLGNTSACEPFVVNKAQLVAATTIHDSAHNVVPVSSSVPVSSVLHDTAQITGQVAGIAPSGAVTFTFYTNSTDCSAGGAAIATAASPDAGNGDPRSVDTSALASGNYAFKAAIAGDTNYTGGTSACEPFSVNKAQLQIATTIHNAAHTAVTAPVALGSVLHDTAQVTGKVSGFDPSGAVTFTFYTNSTDCSGGGASIATAASPDAGNGDPRSVDTSTLAAGNYAFKAAIAGDTNYVGGTSACEPFTVSKQNTSSSTELHNDTTDAVLAIPSPLGTKVHDKATVVGSPVVSGFTPSGTVDFTFFTGGDCLSGTPVAAGTVTLANGVAHPSNTEGGTNGLAAGNYAFLAHYNGDSNFNASSSECEPFTISPTGSVSATEIHNDSNEAVIPVGSSVPLGTKVHDKATVAGNPIVAGLNPTGNVAFMFFTGDCSSESSVSAGTVALNNSVAHPSSTEGGTSGLAAGSYAFQAHYNGDTNFTASTSACEPFTVSKASPSIATVVKDSTGKTVDTESTAALGTVVHDTSMLSGGVTGFALGNGTMTGADAATVTYEFFTSLNCTGEPTSQTVTVAADGTVPNATIPAGQPLGAGNYSYRAIYNGNANYNPATGACEPFAITKGTPSAGTTLHNASGGGIIANGTALDNGSGVFDTAQITTSDSFALTGTVTFQFFTNGSCTGTPAATQAGVAITNGTATSSSHTGLGTGSYAFNAQYVAGSDPNHLSSAVSGCEPFSVNAPPPPPPASTPQNPAISITKNPKSQTILTGQTATFTIMVTNTGNTTLTNVTVTDPLSPDCNKTSAQIAALASMAPASGSHRVRASPTTARSRTSRPASRTSRLRPGRRPSGPNVTAQDSAPVTVNAPLTPPKPAPTPTHPAIDIVKDPKSQTIGEGGKATFKITVTNTGDVTLTRRHGHRPELAGLQPQPRHARGRPVEELHLHQGQRQGGVRERRDRHRQAADRRTGQRQGQRQHQGGPVHPAAAPADRDRQEPEAPDGDDEALDEHDCHRCQQDHGDLRHRALHDQGHQHRRRRTPRRDGVGSGIAELHQEPRHARRREVEDLQLHQACSHGELHERRQCNGHVAQGRQGPRDRPRERRGNDEDDQHERREVHRLARRDIQSLQRAPLQSAGPVASQSTSARWRRLSGASTAVT